MIQIIFAYVLVLILVPVFLSREAHLLFAFSVLLTLLSLISLYVLIRMLYLEPKHLSFYQQIIPNYQRIRFHIWITDPHVLLGKSVLFSIPGILILAFDHHRSKIHLAELGRQKNEAELKALKNQLNPHFLFNTLNNLYSLTIQKSERAPEVIEYLSEMLDYMLYRTNDKFTYLDKELVVLKNYIALEKIRYGDRIQINWLNKVTESVKIAPLILLTILENAFKHGVKNSAEKAEISNFTYFG